MTFGKLTIKEKIKALRKSHSQLEKEIEKDDKYIESLKDEICQPNNLY